MALSGPAAQAMLGQLGKAGVMSAAANVGGQAMQFAGRMAPYIPAIGQVFGGDPLGAAVTAGATKLTPGGPLAKSLVGLGASMIAPPLLAKAGEGIQQLAGGAGRTEMARGESPGAIPGITPGTGIGFSDADVKRIEELSRITGQSQVDIARQMLPLSNQYRDSEMQRQMQLNQQTGQITGALNRQLYTAQLAQGAQAQAGETTRTMMTAANPYAASAFQYRG
jgi:hypothetical protein